MKPLLLTLLGMLVLAIAVPTTSVAAEDKKPVYIEVQNRSDGGIDLWGMNSLEGDVTVDLELTLSGMTATQHVRTGVVPRRDSLLMARLSRTGGAYKWRYLYYFQPGNKNAKVRDTVYLLPYAQDFAALMGQGYFGSFSHQKKRAIDFTMPEGTTIRAARGGTVMRTESRYTEGGIAERFRDRSNYVQIQHDDGSVGAYHHLSPGGVLVSGGQAVAAGQAIGLSGTTGFSSQPHLHFEVTVPNDGRSSRTLVSRFKTTDGVIPGANLQKGRRYLAL